MSITDYCRWGYLTPENIPSGADPDKLVCDYQFDGSVDSLKDRCQNGHDLTYASGAPFYANAEGSLGVNFVEFRTNRWAYGAAGYYPGTVGELTVEAVWLPTWWSTQTDYIFLVGDADSETEDGNITISIRCNNTADGGRLGVLIEYHNGTPASDYSFDFDFIGTINQVQYIAVTREADGVTYRLYLNGVLVQTFVASQAPTGGAGAGTHIAVAGVSSGSDLYGYVSSLRYTKEKYSDAQIAESYENIRNVYCGAWDETPPTITPIDPTDGEEGVERNASISFDVETENGTITFSTIKAWVDGALVFSGGSFSKYWEGSYTAIDSGWRIVLVPKRAAGFDALDEVKVRAYAENSYVVSVDETWAFTIGRIAGIRIYPMLFDGARRLDEER